MTAAPPLSLLCPCGHAARLHGDFGCGKAACGCSRDRDEATSTVTDQPAAAVVEQPVAASSAPAPDPSPGAGADTTEPVSAAGAEASTAGLNFAKLAQALKSGRGHADRKIAALATRIDGELQALADRLADYDAKKAGRDRVAQLEADLAEARNLLRGTPPTSKSTGTGTCPDCGRTGLKNVGAHQFRAHGTKAG